MLVVVERLRRQLSGQERQLQHFSERQYQAEGWIKAGFLQLLDELKEQGLVESVEREKLCGRGREKVDVVFQVRGLRHWVELKHWLIGPQKGTVWKLPAYFDGLELDARKLTSVLGPRDRGWILSLCTANPREPDWRNTVKNFNADNRRFRLIRRSTTEQYPSSHFLGLMECRRT